MSAIKYCEDCKWCRPGMERGAWPWSKPKPRYDYAQCAHPDADGKNRIARELNHPRCAFMRATMLGDLAPCGKEGRLFEARGEQP